MGSLITEIPHSEVTATLELLVTLGVTRKHLDRLRRNRDSVATQNAIACLLKFGHQDDPICSVEDPIARSGYHAEHGGSSAPWKVWDAKGFVHALVPPDFKELEWWLERSEARFIPVWETISIINGIPKYAGSLSAHALDFLLHYPNLIPESCKDKTIIFSATRYFKDEGPNDHSFFRALRWSKTKGWHDVYIDGHSAFNRNKHYVANIWV